MLSINPMLRISSKLMFALLPKWWNLNFYQSINHSINVINYSDCSIASSRGGSRILKRGGTAHVDNLLSSCKLYLPIVCMQSMPNLGGLGARPSRKF